MLGKFNFTHWKSDQKEVFNVALPAMFTNIATPLGNAYVTMSIAAFGDGYVAGWAVIGRLLPVAFGMVFAVSGAIGPIIGQNFGAELYDRVRTANKQAIFFTTGYVVFVSVIIFLLSDQIINLFKATGDAAQMIQFYCSWLCISFIFNGLLFVSNSTFNNLGFPKTSTVMNICKSTIGTIPFVYFGSLWFGAIGVVAGQAVGAIIFGLLAWAWSHHIVKNLGNKDVQGEEDDEISLDSQLPLTPFCSSRAYICPNSEEETLLVEEKK